ncbi:Hydantoin utilization protein B [Bosea sp. 62]|uniref:hydantoinase B/oxoprolinase family protein n=1 Tax=unclassified Bosea (in: a-proteobacteria) TaxID=2653178 RepID=UPI00125BF12F|nr:MULTISPECIES: hydantoinase B/oxoprolinase family protein [unclassified Bosea (in: a-proteobacteria)]CAD5293383.1 Hydantoin utilization protein B [Bosea sp. 21B]CAD5293940.1 Hydantoin utilization protein B [Bosea sp. 46]CAD5299313.1 Hydantoin utilization protein B [Bosea sp. 7B]VVT62164.1 N-methylhydantoinase B [Bosea sp. EC-HK365B]VXB10738.1 Hydantoin utilization protein B [Bosea sp. 125]
MVDKVTLQVLANHCRAAAENMAYTLYRTAHSTFVKETEDFTVMVMDRTGRVVAVPMDLGATWYPGMNYNRAIEMVPEYRPGDIAFTNDPYSGYLATHAPDTHLWKPIFHDGEIVCFVGGHVHNTDMGGAVPASLSRSLTEIHQEGIRFPPMTLMRDGAFDETVLRIMMMNVRKPALNMGDLKALAGALNTGERKIQAMVAKFGAKGFMDGLDGLMDYAEHQAREILRSIPDGEYVFSDYADEDGVDGNPCRLALMLTIKGDEAILDFTGSDPQLGSSLNVPTGSDPRHTLLLVGVYYVLYTLNPQLLLNSGLTRPFTCIAPEGTVLNPSFPAAVGMRSLTCARLRSLIFGAFSLAAPERLPAAPAGSSSIVNVMTTDEKTHRSVIAAINPVVGGGGGMPHRDGPNGSGADAAYLKNTPIEITETEVPIRFMRYGLLPDSGGGGRWRGGLATVMEFKVFSPNSRITVRNRDRSHFRPWGTLGGLSAETSNFIINPGRPNERILGNTDIAIAEPGDVIHIHSPGGGGRGSPLEREPERVLLDVERGYVSLDAARTLYGVVIETGVVDHDATAALRAELRAHAHKTHFHFGPERDAFEQVWTAENYAALTRLLAGLPIHWRFFTKTKLFAAMRDAAGELDLAAAFAVVRQNYPQIPEAGQDRPEIAQAAE